jgi:hypothetical protein
MKTPFTPRIPFHDVQKKVDVYTSEDWENVNYILQHRYQSSENETEDETCHLPTKLRSITKIKILEDLFGFVHNATAGTCIQMANELKMDPEKSIWTDFGSGGLCFGIQGSLFNLQTWCLDLPSVMEAIAENLNEVTEDQKRLVLPINYIAGDCLELDREDYPSDFFKTTHLTNFIGIVPGMN